MSQRSGATVRNAARAIEKYGWVQQTNRSPSGMCIRGAIDYIEAQYSIIPDDWRSAEDEFSEWMDSIGQYHEVRMAHPRAVDASTQDLAPAWNDQPERTKEEVLLYMNKFADEVDPQGP